MVFKKFFLAALLGGATALYAGDTTGGSAGGGLAEGSYLPAISAPAANAADSWFGTSQGLACEGATPNSGEIIFQCADAGEDALITFPADYGTVALTHQVAMLNGVSGGQSIWGGTQVGDPLALCNSTSYSSNNGICEILTDDTYKLFLNSNAKFGVQGGKFSVFTRGGGSDTNYEQLSIYGDSGDSVGGDGYLFIAAETGGTGDDTVHIRITPAGASGNVYIPRLVIGSPDSGGVVRNNAGNVRFDQAADLAGGWWFGNVAEFSMADFPNVFRFESRARTCWANDTDYHATLDTCYGRDGSSGTFSIYHSTDQQSLRVYNTRTDASNYERVNIGGVSGTSVNVTAETAGTGVDNLDIILTPAGTGKVKVGTTPVVLEQTKCMTIPDPASGDDFLFFRAENAITITGIDCLQVGGTSVATLVKECDADGGTCSNVEASITCGATNSTEASSIDNSSIDAGDWLRIDPGTVTGSVTQLSVCVNYTL